MMNQETYDYVLEIVSREPSFSEGIRQLKKKWPTVNESISDKTLKSIQAQYYVRRMRRNHHHHYSRETREKYFKLYKDAKSRNEKNVIMRLAAKNDISPCLLARIILEEYYWNDVDHGRERSDGRGSLPPGFMTDCIRDIAKLPNPELAREIYETIVLDNFYGPVVDSIKKSCGVEYEAILKAHCRKAGLSFIDESQMREEGYDKTPDIRLKVPVMINSRVVNWIESKASFGDPINHQQYMIDQYLPYKNRFGPGAVIYWFGFVQELAETGERGILLLSKFPEADEITHLRDVHEQERMSVRFQLLHQNTEADVDNYDELGNAECSAFYNCVDSMFDSDEEVDQARGSVEAFKPSCIFSNVISETRMLEKPKTHEYLYSLENVFAGMSVENVHDIENHVSTPHVESENFMLLSGNKLDNGSAKFLSEDLSCTHNSNSYETAANSDFEKLPGIKSDGDSLCPSGFSDIVNNTGDVHFPSVDVSIGHSPTVYQCDRNASCSLDHICDQRDLPCSPVSTKCPEAYDPACTMNQLNKSLSFPDSTAVLEDNIALNSCTKSVSDSDKNIKKKKSKRNR